MTLDTPMAGVVIAQPARGFRYAVDAFWLAGMALTSGPAADAVDLGTGSGILAMLLAAHGVPTVGIDRDPSWGPLWVETLARSRVPASVRLVDGDVLDHPLGPVDLAVANPPYFAAGTGPASPDPRRRAARTESTAGMGDFVRAGLAALRPGGRMCLVVARQREPDVLEASGGARAWVQVGRSRSLFTLQPGTPAVDRATVLQEDHPTVLEWVRRATTPPAG